MVGQLVPIDLDKPFAEQQSVKELLKLPEDKTKKLGFDQLLEIAKVAVRSELVSCGCSENALTGLRLEYLSQAGADQPEEKYVLEWTKLNQSNSSIEAASTEEPPQLSDSFHTRLFNRLDAELPKGGNLTANRIKFRGAEDSSGMTCCGPEPDTKSYYKIIDNNGDEKYVLKDGQKWECGNVESGNRDVII